MATPDTPGSAWISPRTGKPLSAYYQRRLSRAGITAESYSAGTVPLGVARGHREEARLIRVPGQEPVLNPKYRPRATGTANRWISEALALRIDKPEVCPYFSTYPKVQQEEAARTYLAFTNPTKYAAERRRLVKKRFGDRSDRTPQQLIYMLMQIQMNKMQVPYTPGPIMNVTMRPTPLDDVYHNFIYYYLRGMPPQPDSIAA